MEIVKNKYDLLVDSKDQKNPKIAKSGSLFVVLGFNDFNVYLKPPFEVDENVINVFNFSDDTKALCFNINTFECCFEKASSDDVLINRNNI